MRARQRPPGAPAKRPLRQRFSPPVLLYCVFAMLLVFEVGAARSLLFSDGSVWRTIGLEAAFVLALLSIVEALGSRWRLVTYGVSAVVVSVSLLAIVIYASWADRLLSVDSVRLAAEAWGARASVAALFQPRYALFLVGALLPVGLVYFFRDDLSGGDERRHPVLLALGAVALVSCVFLTEVAGNASAAGDSLAVGQSHGLLAYEVSAALQESGKDSENLGASVIRSSVDVSNPTSVDARVDQILGRNHSVRIADFKPGAYAGANIIVIQVESMQGFVIGLKAESQEVTPHLNELAKESWYFPNAFSQIGPGTTSDAEFVMNTSLYAPRNSPASIAYVGKDVPSLPKLLRDDSYYSFTMHANTVKFWNRSQLYPTLGFGGYYDRQFFGTDDTVGMGMSDGLMFRKALPAIEDEAKNGKFYCQIITLSPHHPFRLPDSKVKLDLPDWLGGTVVGDYLECMNYEDRCIGSFVDKLKKAGLWDGSIVVIYGDHYGLRPTDLSENDNRARYERLLGHSYTGLDRTNIPLFIHLPRQTAGREVANPVGQADIMPSIADALGIDLTGVPHFGQSVFEQARSLVPLNAPMAMGTFVDGDMFYVGNAETHVPITISLKTRSVTTNAGTYLRSSRDARELTQLSAAYLKGLPNESGMIVPSDAILRWNPRK